MLSEHILDNNAHGWFTPAWRDGRHAIKLARTVAMVLPEGNNFPDNTQEILSLLDNYRDRIMAYEHAGELCRGLIQPTLNTNTSRLLAAALRCLQLDLSNSHGGGVVYNEVLIPAFLPIDAALVEKIVLEWRCQDAIGTTHHMQGDAKDRQRHAFTIAWQRGLYFAAYAIKVP